MALVLGVLLYGCESWFLREKESEKMQRFHHDCVRTMLRINWHQQWKRKIKMKQLFAELGNCVRPLRWHYETRHLRWVGHIAHMKHDRLPLMLLTSWVPHSRPIGCPRMTFGRTVKKAMKRREEIWPGGTALPNFILYPKIFPFHPTLRIFEISECHGTNL